MKKRGALPGITRRNIVAMASIIGGAALAGISSSRVAHADNNGNNNNGNNNNGNPCFLRGDQDLDACR
jgi:hypothetical protein